MISNLQFNFLQVQAPGRAGKCILIASEVAPGPGNTI